MPYSFFLLTATQVYRTPYTYLQYRETEGDGGDDGGDQLSSQSWTFSGF